MSSRSHRDAVFRAIAHRGRRKLLSRLRSAGGLTLRELCQGLSMTRQAVSQHLELLESARLVTTRRHGREKLHYLNPIPLCDVHDAWLAPLITPESRALTGLRDAIEAARSATRKARSRG